MSLILYVKDQDGAGKRLQRVIEAVLPPSQMTVITDKEVLDRRLTKPRDGVNIAVLLASTRQDLEGLLTLADPYWELRIILILPDREGETISKGHSLRPRFLTFSDSNFEDVEAVLRKMLEIMDPKGNPLHDPDKVLLNMEEAP